MRGKAMKIIHIAHINNDPCSGVDVVVPEHVRAQERLAEVELLNVTNERIEGVRRQLLYKKAFSFDGSRPDLAVFHEVYRVQYLRLASKLKRKNIPYIIIPHGELNVGAQKKKALKKRIANLLIFNRFINNAAALQMLSEREMRSTKHGRVKFIGTNGINIPPKYKESFDKHKLSLVFIGRLDVYHKGLDLMLEGVSTCADEMRKCGCTLDIYGPDHNGSRQKLERIIKNRGISDIVRLHSEVSGKRKERILLFADLFIQTSRFEGMPMGILEALAYGLPCIVSEGTTLSKFISDSRAGWECHGDAASVSSAIKSAIAARDNFKVISKNARECVARDFSWDKVAADCINSYKMIFGEKI
jgi:glycosyltransferase involved in cell wall biosynthesis